MSNRQENNYRNNDQDLSKSWVFKCIVILLLIVIIILLLLNSCGAIDYTNHGEYTGNFDIYEIQIKGTCECPKCETCKKCDNSTNKTDPVNSDKEDPVKEEDPYENDDGLIVYDEEDKWTENGEESYTPTIFKHSMYEVVDGKIAPGSSNTYEFIVRNLNEFKVKYTIKGIEINTKNINMKYRLRLDNTYILGSDTQWVDASSLQTAFKELDAKSKHTYFLDWKWFDDIDLKDTTIGIDETSVYSLSLKVEAEEL